MDAAEVEPSPNGSTIKERAHLVECDMLKVCKALLVIKRDRVMKEKEDADKDRDVTVEQRDRAYIDCDAAKATCYRAVVECDCVFNRLDTEARMRDELESKTVDLEREL
jgi:hypothetical protein